MIFGASYLAQLPAIAAMTSGSDVAFILLTTIGGLGSLTGVLWVAIRGGTSPNLRLAFLGCLALGSAVVMLALVRSMPLAVVALFIAGASQFLATTVSQYVIQAAVDDHYRGRVLSLFYWAWGGMMPVGGLLLGVLMALLGVSTALVLTGLATILGSAGLWWVYRREGPKTRRVKPS
jgi:predicted MFS family arabinose efflux permease